MEKSLNQYLIRVGIFLFLILIVIIFLYPILQNSFLSNIYINLIICLSLLSGLFFNIYQLAKLNSDYLSLSNFNIHKAPQVFLNSSPILKNLPQQMYENNSRYSFKSSKIDKIIENADISLLSIRETSKYFVGLLVFLGLLGTFWGLLKTIGSVGNVISGLGIDDTNVAGFFNSLKDGLNAPLQGMSIAFSSSLLGLAGSLILGFLDLNLGQAQNKFSQYFEKTLENNTSVDFKNGNLSDATTLSAIQNIYDNLDSLVYALNETSQKQNQTYNYLKSLSEQMKDLNKNSKEQDKKLSNYLSTQLNTQSDIVKFTNQLSKEGILDKESKKYFKNIDKNLQGFLSKLKNK